MKKWETSKNMVPAPELYQENNENKEGILFFGTSTFAAEEALDILKENGKPMDAMRLKSFPFNETVENFINNHEKIYVVEQNRDAQMKSLLTIELGINPSKLISVLNYDGTPITADMILNQISNKFATESLNLNAFLWSEKSNFLNFSSTLKEILYKLSYLFISRLSFFIS